MNSQPSSPSLLLPRPFGSDSTNSLENSSRVGSQRMDPTTNTSISQHNTSSNDEFNDKPRTIDAKNTVVAAQEIDSNEIPSRMSKSSPNLQSSFRVPPTTESTPSLVAYTYVPSGSLQSQKIGEGEEAAHLSGARNQNVVRRQRKKYRPTKGRLGDNVPWCGGQSTSSSSSEGSADADGEGSTQTSSADDIIGGGSEEGRRSTSSTEDDADTTSSSSDYSTASTPRGENVNTSTGGLYASEEEEELSSLTRLPGIVDVRGDPNAHTDLDRAVASLEPGPPRISSSISARPTAGLLLVSPNTATNAHRRTVKFEEANDASTNQQTSTSTRKKKSGDNKIADEEEAYRRRKVHSNIRSRTWRWGRTESHESDAKKETENNNTTVEEELDDSDFDDYFDRLNGGIRDDFRSMVDSIVRSVLFGTSMTKMLIGGSRKKKGDGDEAESSSSLRSLMAYISNRRIVTEDLLRSGFEPNDIATVIEEALRFHPLFLSFNHRMTENEYLVSQYSGTSTAYLSIMIVGGIICSTFLLYTVLITRSAAEPMDISVMVAVLSGFCASATSEMFRLLCSKRLLLVDERLRRFVGVAEDVLVGRNNNNNNNSGGSGLVKCTPPGSASGSFSSKNAAMLLSPTSNGGPRSSQPVVDVKASSNPSSSTGPTATSSGSSGFNNGDGGLALNTETMDLRKDQIFCRQVRLALAGELVTVGSMFALAIGLICGVPHTNRDAQCRIASTPFVSETTQVFMCDFYIPLSIECVAALSVAVRRPRWVITVLMLLFVLMSYLMYLYISNNPASALGALDPNSGDYSGYAATGFVHTASKRPIPALGAHQQSHSPFRRFIFDIDASLAMDLLERFPLVLVEYLTCILMRLFTERADRRLFANRKRQSAKIAQLRYEQASMQAYAEELVPKLVSKRILYGGITQDTLPPALASIVGPGMGLTAASYELTAHQLQSKLSYSHLTMRSLGRELRGQLERLVLEQLLRNSNLMAKDSVRGGVLGAAANGQSPRQANSQYSGASSLHASRAASINSRHKHIGGGPAPSDMSIAALSGSPSLLPQMASPHSSHYASANQLASSLGHNSLSETLLPAAPSAAAVPHSSMIGGSVVDSLSAALSPPPPLPATTGFSAESFPRAIAQLTDAQLMTLAMGGKDWSPSASVLTIGFQDYVAFVNHTRPRDVVHYTAKASAAIMEMLTAAAEQRGAFALQRERFGPQHHHFSHLCYPHSISNHGDTYVAVFGLIAAPNEGPEDDPVVPTEGIPQTQRTTSSLAAEAPSDAGEGTAAGQPQPPLRTYKRYDDMPATSRASIEAFVPSISAATLLAHIAQFNYSNTMLHNRQGDSNIMPHLGFSLHTGPVLGEIAGKSQSSWRYAVSGTTVDEGAAVLAHSRMGDPVLITSSALHALGPAVLGVGDGHCPAIIPLPPAAQYNEANCPHANYVPQMPASNGPELQRFSTNQQPQMVSSNTAQAVPSYLYAYRCACINLNVDISRFVEDALSVGHSQLEHELALVAEQQPAQQQKQQPSSDGLVSLVSRVQSPAFSNHSHQSPVQPNSNSRVDTPVNAAIDKRPNGGSSAGGFRRPPRATGGEVSHTTSVLSTSGHPTGSPTLAHKSDSQMLLARKRNYHNNPNPQEREQVDFLTEIATASPLGAAPPQVLSECLRSSRALLQSVMQEQRTSFRLIGGNDDAAALLGATDPSALNETRDYNKGWRRFFGYFGAGGGHPGQSQAEADIIGDAGLDVDAEGADTQLSSPTSPGSPIQSTNGKGGRSTLNGDKETADFWRTGKLSWFLSIRKDRGGSARPSGAKRNAIRLLLAETRDLYMPWRFADTRLETEFELYLCYDSFKWPYIVMQIAHILLDSLILFAFVVDVLILYVATGAAERTGWSPRQQANFNFWTWEHILGMMTLTASAVCSLLSIVMRFVGAKFELLDPNEIKEAEVSSILRRNEWIQLHVSSWTERLQLWLHSFSTLTDVAGTLTRFQPSTTITPRQRRLWRHTQSVIFPVLQPILTLAGVAMLQPSRFSLDLAHIQQFLCVSLVFSGMQMRTSGRMLAVFVTGNLAVIAAVVIGHFSVLRANTFIIIVFISVCTALARVTLDRQERAAFVAVKLRESYCTALTKQDEVRRAIVDSAIPAPLQEPFENLRRAAKRTLMSRMEPTSAPPVANANDKANATVGNARLVSASALVTDNKSGSPTKTSKAVTIAPYTSGHVTDKKEKHRHHNRSSSDKQKSPGHAGKKGSVDSERQVSSIGGHASNLFAFLTRDTKSQVPDQLELNKTKSKHSKRDKSDTNKDKKTSEAHSSSTKKDKKKKHHQQPPASNSSSYASTPEITFLPLPPALQPHVAQNLSSAAGVAAGASTSGIAMALPTPTSAASLIQQGTNYISSIYNIAMKSDSGDVFASSDQKGLPKGSSVGSSTIATSTAHPPQSPFHPDILQIGNPLSTNNISGSGRVSTNSYKEAMKALKQAEEEEDEVLRMLAAEEDEEDEGDEDASEGFGDDDFANQQDPSEDSGAGGSVGTTGGNDSTSINSAVIAAAQQQALQDRYLKEKAKELRAALVGPEAPSEIAHNGRKATVVVVPPSPQRPQANHTVQQEQQQSTAPPLPSQSGATICPPVTASSVHIERCVLVRLRFDFSAPVHIHASPLPATNANTVSRPASLDDDQSSSPSTSQQQQPDEGSLLRPPQAATSAASTTPPISPDTMPPNQISTVEAHHLASAITAVQRAVHVSSFLALVDAVLARFPLLSVMEVNGSQLVVGGPWSNTPNARFGVLAAALATKQKGGDKGADDLDGLSKDGDPFSYTKLPPASGAGGVAVGKKLDRSGKDSSESGAAQYPDQHVDVAQSSAGKLNAPPTPSETSVAAHLLQARLFLEALAVEGRRTDTTFTAITTADDAIIMLRNSLYPSFDVLGTGPLRCRELIRAAAPGTIAFTESFVSLWRYQPIFLRTEAVLSSLKYGEGQALFGHPMKGESASLNQLEASKSFELPKSQIAESGRLLLPTSFAVLSSTSTPSLEQAASGLIQALALVKMARSWRCRGLPLMALYTRGLGDTAVVE